MNKCIKVAIKSCNEMSKKELSDMLRDLRYLTCKASNKAMQMYYTWENDKREYKNEHGTYPSEKDMFGKTYRNVVEGKMKEIMDIVNTSNVGQTNAFVMKKWNTDKRDVLNYRKSLASFKLEMPVYLKNTSYKIIQGNKGYEVECSLFNKKYQKENNIKKLTLNIDKLGGSEKATLNKLIAGSYKQGSAQISQDKKGKWYFTISFSFEIDKKPLDYKRILGVDLGITNAAALSIWDDNYKEWDRLSWRNRILDGKELIHYRQKIQARRIGLLKNGKLAEVGQGKAGHGRNTRTKAIEKISDKVNKFRDTLNHKYSRYIVDFALKHNCGVIQIENLEGFTEKSKESLLKNWSYYDLQSKILYKSEEVGIEVRKVKPQYTSKRCSECGKIHEDNRDCKNNQAKFLCVECGYKENADINASKNIALPNIEELIKIELKGKK